MLPSDMNRFVGNEGFILKCIIWGRQKWCLGDRKTNRTSVVMSARASRRPATCPGQMRPTSWRSAGDSNRLGDRLKNRLKLYGIRHKWSDYSRGVFKFQTRSRWTIRPDGPGHGSSDADDGQTYRLLMADGYYSSRHHLIITRRNFEFRIHDKQRQRQTIICKNISLIKQVFR